ncbi:MAG: hypothetical protein M3T55_13625, partial [Pseudomonadota bacterium]|nr:hypothetical protein [Pseudomonadota bacterium]
AGFRSDMKLLYIARNPIERIMSHYRLWCQTKPMEYSNADIDFANTKRKVSINKAKHVMRDVLVNRSKYMMQIDQYRR